MVVVEKRKLEENDILPARQTLANLAKYSGFFDVWMSVFHDDPDMRK